MKIVNSVWSKMGIKTLPLESEVIEKMENGSKFKLKLQELISLPLIKKVRENLALSNKKTFNIPKLPFY